MPKKIPSSQPESSATPNNAAHAKAPVRWTLKTVAQKLGVSTATVSNAFNRPDQLSIDKRDFILAQCSQLGYQGPNKAARSLRRGKTGIIALVMSDNLRYTLSDPVASEFTQGVAAGLESQQRHMLMYSGSSKSLDEISDFVDGFICYGTPRNFALIEEMQRVNKPVVTVDFNLPERPAVNIDNVAAAREIAALAVQQVKGPVAVLGLRLLSDTNMCEVELSALPDLTSSVSTRRLLGYQQALQAQGIALNTQYTLSLPESTPDAGEQAAAQVLALTPRPQVLLCMSDLIALGAMKYAKQQGLRIPEDLRIVGFDGIAEARRAEPSLTSIQQFSEQKGRRAAELFNDISSAPAEQFLPYQLLNGETI